MRTLTKGKADKFIDDYMDLFSSYSFMNKMYGMISLHVIIGQMVCYNIYYKMGSRIIEPRVHMFLIKPQGTGKGAGFSFVEKLIMDLKYDFQSLTESTDAGLAGIVKYNKKTQQDEVIEGLLKDADFTGYSNTWGFTPHMHMS